MTEEHEDEATEPEVTDVPEPDQEAHDAEQEAAESEDAERESDDEANERLAGDEGEHEGGAFAAEQEASQPAFDQKAIDKIFKQLDGEASRHAKRLGEIMGEDAQDLVLCPMCGPVDGMPNLAGFVLNAPLHPEAEARVKAALGLDDTTQLLEAKHVRPCEDCAAWGVVKTGSHVARNEVIMCPTCSGNGYTLIGAPAQVFDFATANGTEGTASTATPQAIGPEPPEAAALRARGYAVIPPPATG